MANSFVELMVASLALVLLMKVVLTLALDVDVCRAVAAALFDDPEAVEYRRLDSTERFEALERWRGRHALS